MDFVDGPVYLSSYCTGFQNTNAQNLLFDPSLDLNEKGLRNALNELIETFRDKNIDGLASLLDPSVGVAVYFRGHYKYSIAAHNLADIVRDGLGSMRPFEFFVDYVHQRAPGVFAFDARHRYRDAQGAYETMYLSFVLQDIGGEWTLTQFESAPGYYQPLTH